MKKILSLCVCLVMIVGACSMPSITESAFGGKSNGKNAKIKTKTEFAELLQSASMAISQMGSETSLVSAASNESSSFVSAVKNADDTLTGIPYSEMTIYETVTTDVEYLLNRRDEFSKDKSLSGIQYADIKTTTKADSVIYLTDDAVLIKANGTIISDVETEEATTKYVQGEGSYHYGIYVPGGYVEQRDQIIRTSYKTDVNMEMAMYIDEDNAYLMINRYDAHKKDNTADDDKDDEDREEAEKAEKEAQEQINLLAGKWIDLGSLGDETYSMVAPLMSILKSVLQYESEYFLENFDKTFTKTYDIYTLNSDALEDYVDGNEFAHSEAYGELSDFVIGIADLKDISGYLTIDLSTATAPKLVRKISGYYSEGKDAKYQVNSYCKLSFANINNTQIVKPTNALTAEELEELYN